MTFAYFAHMLAAELERYRVESVDPEARRPAA